MARYHYDKDGNKIWRDWEDELLEALVTEKIFTHEQWDHAYWLRQNMTYFEKKLWAFLGGDDNQWQFLRQFPVEGSNYFPDFYSRWHKVCIEADGPEHLKTVEADIKREKALLKLGVRMFHITPAEFFSQFQPSDLLKAVSNFVHTADAEAEESSRQPRPKRMVETLREAKAKAKAEKLEAKRLKAEAREKARAEKIAARERKLEEKAKAKADKEASRKVKKTEDKKTEKVGAGHGSGIMG